MLSKLAWLLLSPGNLLVVMVVAGAALSFCRFWRWGRGLVVASALLGGSAMALPVGDWLLLPLENRFPGNPPLPERIDGIVLLTGASDPEVAAARAQMAFNGAGERIAAFAMLAASHPEARLMIAGGSGDLLPASISEARADGRAAEALGIDHLRLTLEETSRDTFENAVMARELARPLPGESWVLVTSAAHMPRAVGAFRAVGWPVIPWPVDFRTTGAASLRGPADAPESLARLGQALHEWLGLAAYRVAGRSDALFPAPAPIPEQTAARS
ncbi:MAG: YdcF family protein [Alphaproteobacteria bacterium]|nr:YdcF family protein [Alphaproteobacteria bacterium]